MVISGHLSVIHEDSNEEVLRIFKKDFYMDVEILYDMESQYKVVACDA